jgi:hypothetical protein
MISHTLVSLNSNYKVFSLPQLLFMHMIQFRGSEVIELQHFEPASTDDIASVHARAYVSGLEKVTFFVKKLSLLQLFHM